MKEFFSNIHYSNDLSTSEQLISFVLMLGVPFYWLGSQIKNWLYDFEILTPQKIDNAFVISIGNITTGGVGKTPIVAELANALSKNYPVAILSRGYGGSLSYEQINVIKSEGKINYTAQQAGDEPYWLAQNTNDNVNVLTCANRVESANYAVKELGCKVIILDDGFQHRKIARDIDIVVFDAFKLVGNASLLPLGPLRESLSNIKRADKIILTNKNLPQETFDNIAQMTQEKFNKPIIKCNVVPNQIYNIKTYTPPENINEIGAFCAIGQPMLFFQYLNKYNLQYAKSFDDHHNYTQEDIDELTNAARKKELTALITTEKDAVKIKDFNFKGVDIYALPLKLDLNIEELINEET